MSQLYSLPLEGGRPQLESSLTMLEVSPSADGSMLYTDYKGYEDNFRKHHTSSIARDIWHRTRDGKFTKLTSFKGEDRNAVWDGKGGFYYLSEEDGTFNVYHRSSLKDEKSRQLTHFKGNPVRFLSRSNDGTLCFGYDGEIYTLRDGKKPEKVKISILTDVEPTEERVRTLTSGATSYAVSPTGGEFAVVVAGDVFVINMEYGTSRRITSTPEEERGVTFAPDGRTLVYASMRGGQWQLYKSEITNKKEKKFVYAVDIKETQLTREKKPCFAPLFSPKGGEVAFLRDRDEVAVLNLKSGAIRTVVPMGVNFSYTDGDQHFEWSRNGKYILSNSQANGGWSHTDVALYHADGSGLVKNLTESGYSDQGGRFALDDKAVLFISDRSGYRSHGSWGATGDVYLMFLEDKAYQTFAMTKEDKTLAEDEKKANEEEKKAKDADKKDDKKKDNKKKSDKKSDKKDDKADKAEGESKSDKPAKSDKNDKIAYNFDEREVRTIRISRTSGSISDAVISPDGKKLYYIARYESQNDLWEYDLEERSSKILAPNTSGSFIVSADGKEIYLGTSTSLRKIGGKTYNVRVEQEHKPVAERAHIFDHVQTTINDKFYDVNLHGVDWAGYGKTYKKFLPHITEPRDFAEMLSEMLGELNASHTGATNLVRRPLSQPTSVLGAFYDADHKGDGLRIEEILPGSPLFLADKPVKAGMVILEVEGQRIEADKPYEPLFAGRAGKRTRLLVEEGGKTFTTYVKPIPMGVQQQLLRRRWIARREALVKEWSNGRIAYVHVPEMNSPSFRTVFKDLLGKYRSCDAVVVDTRYNGGGWLHEDLAVLLSGKKFSTMAPRGRYAGDDPFMQWNKPSCVLMNEGNYSNGHGFPYTYRQLGIGKLIGTPVAGTMTAVWWERLFSGTLVYGIPQVTINDNEGKSLENQQLYPLSLIHI